MKSSSKRWRQLTAPFRMRPDFIIPGEAKCGTTSLYQYLCLHPDIFPATMKEPNNFWRHGASPLQCGQYYPLKMIRFLRGLLGKRTLTGEASPEYLTKSGVAQSILEVVPKARLVFLFRNPVDRAFSDHQMLVKAGVENDSFSECMERSLRWWQDKETRLLLRVGNDLEHHPGRYLLRGLYAENLGQWIECFPREQILFLESENLFSNPEIVVNQVVEFLGLDAANGQEWKVFKKGHYKEEIDPSLRNELEDFFRESNRRLAELTGRDWSWGH